MDIFLLLMRGGFIFDDLFIWEQFYKNAQEHPSDVFGGHAFKIIDTPSGGNDFIYWLSGLHAQPLFRLSPIYN